MLIVRNAAILLRDRYGPQVEVYYAGNLGGPGAIHPEIWTHIRAADIVIADLTGYNANVVYELGVAAAWRPIETVIILRDTSDGLTHAFDLQPARQRFYDSRAHGWSDQLAQWLVEDMVRCIARSPFRDEPSQPMALPFEHAFQNWQDTSALYSPGPGHKRTTEDGLEFGSPLYFPYSWLSPVGIRPTDVRIRAEMRFAERLELPWIGIAVRSQGYLANQEHLAWLGSDGNVRHTGPGENAQGADEHTVGRISGFDLDADEFVPFDISIDSTAWSIRIGDVEQVIPLAELPYVFGQGRILLQAWRCRAVVRTIEIELL